MMYSIKNSDNGFLSCSSLAIFIWKRCSNSIKTSQILSGVLLSNVKIQSWVIRFNSLTVQHWTAVSQLPFSFFIVSTALTINSSTISNSYFLSDQGVARRFPAMAPHLLHLKVLNHVQATVATFSASCKPAWCTEAYRVTKRDAIIECAGKDSLSLHSVKKWHWQSNKSSWPNRCTDSKFCCCLHNQKVSQPQQIIKWDFCL